VITSAGENKAEKAPHKAREKEEKKEKEKKKEKKVSFAKQTVALTPRSRRGSLRNQ
jgi:hypothetical protein